MLASTRPTCRTTVLMATSMLPMRSTTTLFATCMASSSRSPTCAWCSEPVQVALGPGPGRAHANHGMLTPWGGGGGLLLVLRLDEVGDEVGTGCSEEGQGGTHRRLRRHGERDCKSKKTVGVARHSQLLLNSDAPKQGRHAVNANAGDLVACWCMRRQ